jgi:hypothetical protein
MTTLQKLQIAAALAVVLALTVLGRTPQVASFRARLRSVAPASIWLGVVAASLLIVGVVSQTFLRHVVQIAPLILALVVVGRWPGGANAAAPLFAFWLLVMIGIWAFLLGIARIFPGTFTGTEITLTVVIAAASLAGLLATSGAGSTAPIAVRLALVGGFAFLQYAAMWIAAQPFVGR